MALGNSKSNGGPVELNEENGNRSFGQSSKYLLDTRRTLRFRTHLDDDMRKVRRNAQIVNPAFALKGDGLGGTRGYGGSPQLCAINHESIAFPRRTVNDR